MASGRWMYQKKTAKKASYNGMNKKNYQCYNNIARERECLKQF